MHGGEGQVERDAQSGRLEWNDQMRMVVRLSRAAGLTQNGVDLAHEIIANLQGAFCNGGPILRLCVSHGTSHDDGNLPESRLGTLL